jgi:hypothetical protein
MEGIKALLEMLEISIYNREGKEHWCSVENMSFHE